MSQYLSLAVCRLLIVYKVLSITSHICFLQKSTTLAYVLEVAVTLSHLLKQALQIFYTTKFIFFLLIFFHSQCLIYSVLYYCITFAFVICFNKEISDTVFLLQKLSPNKKSPPPNAHADRLTTQLNSNQQDITDVGADTSYVRIYISNLIKTL